MGDTRLFLRMSENKDKADKLYVDNQLLNYSMVSNFVRDTVKAHKVINQKEGIMLSFNKTNENAEKIKKTGFINTDDIPLKDKVFLEGEIEKGVDLDFLFLKMLSCYRKFEEGEFKSSIDEDKLKRILDVSLKDLLPKLNISNRNNNEEEINEEEEKEIARQKEQLEILKNNLKLEVDF